MIPLGHDGSAEDWDTKGFYDMEGPKVKAGAEFY
jgi:hypothetical protein